MCCVGFTHLHHHLVVESCRPAWRREACTKLNQQKRSSWNVESHVIWPDQLCACAQHADSISMYVYMSSRETRACEDLKTQKLPYWIQKGISAWIIKLVSLQPS